MRKYELTNETIEFSGRTLHRIRALRDIPAHNVRAGDLGGWIESEKNLSQTGDAWVGDNACVSDGVISGDAWVGGDAQVYGGHISGGYISGGYISGGYISGNARVYGGEISGGVISGGHISRGEISGGRISGGVISGGHISRGEISCTDQILCIGPIGRDNDSLTIIADQDYVNRGCFTGTIEEFLRRVEEVHGENIHGQMYKAAIEMAKLRMKK